MRLKRLLFLFVVFACQEDESIWPTQPALYHKTELRQVSAIRVFTANGEITNPSIVNRFLASDSNFFNYNNLTVRNYGSIDSLQFSPSGNSRLFINYQWNEYEISKQEKLLELSSTLESKICCTSEPITEFIDYHIGKVKPVVTSEYIYSSTEGNYLFGFVGRQRAALQYVDSHWSYPILVYVNHHNNNPTYFHWRNNVLETNFFKHIPVGDTISLQQGSLIFEPE